MRALLRAVALAALLTACSESHAVTEVYGDPESTALEVGVDTCNAGPVVTVEETDTEVRLTVEAEQGDTHGDCQDGVDVELDAPLRDRAVIDASTGDELQVRPPD